ncbi:STAS domain-containing protein [Streptomyces sp. NPDC091268]|uniref:STAS domain-containing protein n=1 Tax=Streptomyces sp. NPDC091268 TaxID=3365979 RepID=UPI003822B78C
MNVGVAFETTVQHAGNTIMVSVAGELDAAAEPALQAVPGELPPSARVALLDVHRVSFMDSAGLLLFLDLHRRLEQGGLRVLVVGWQTQPQRLMCWVAGLPADDDDPCAARQSALTGFRRMIRQGAEGRRALQLSGSASGPRPSTR